MLLATPVNEDGLADLERDVFPVFFLALGNFSWGPGAVTCGAEKCFECSSEKPNSLNLLSRSRDFMMQTCL